MSEEKKQKNFTTGTLATGSKLGEAAKEKWALEDGAEDDETVARASKIEIPKNN